MGRVLRWIKDLFGIRSDSEKLRQRQGIGRRDVRGRGVGEDGEGGGGDYGGRVLFNNPRTIPPNLSPAEAAWLQSFYSGNVNDNTSRFGHAFAVAAATAAAANAARAAAQAAAAVVRLTSGGGGCVGGQWGSTVAAVRIQTVFRGYLARKALRALKALVKLQALVRGYLVRKQAAAALHSMQAMFRAQASDRSLRGRWIAASHDGHCRCDSHKSLERFDEGRSEPTTSSFHSRRLTSCLDSPQSDVVTTDESPKIVEVDTGAGNNGEVTRPRSRSRCGGDLVNRLNSNNRTVQSTPFSVGMIETWVQRKPQDSSEWGLTGDEFRFSTPASTPRLLNGYNEVPVTPSRSICGGMEDDRAFTARRCGYGGDYPSYMASTESFSPKSRSRSAPKQRSGGRRATLNELMQSRSSSSGVRMQRSCTRTQEAINFKNVIRRKLLRPRDERDAEQEHECRQGKL